METKKENSERKIKFLPFYQSMSFNFLFADLKLVFGRRAGYVHVHVTYLLSNKKSH